MTNTITRLQFYTNPEGADCVYSDVTHHISVYERQSHKLLGDVAIGSDDVLCLIAAGLSAQRSYSIGNFLSTLALLYPPQAEPSDVPDKVWERVAESVKVPTRIPAC